jgi:hypothetical protein
MAFRQPFRSGLRELAEGLLKRAQTEREYGQREQELTLHRGQVAGQMMQNMGQIGSQAMESIFRPQEQSTELPERIVKQAQADLERAENDLRTMIAQGAPQHVINGQRRLTEGLRLTVTQPLQNVPGAYNAVMNHGFNEQGLSPRERAAGRRVQEILPSGRQQISVGGAMAASLTEQNQQNLAFATALRERAGTWNLNDLATIPHALSAMESASSLPAHLRAPVIAEARALEHAIQNDPAVAVLLDQATRLRLANLTTAEYGARRAEVGLQLDEAALTRAGVDLQRLRVDLTRARAGLDLDRVNLAAAIEGLEQAQRMNPLRYEELVRDLGDAGAVRFGEALSTGVLSNLTVPERMELASMLELGSDEELVAWGQAKIAEVQEASAAANAMTVLTRDIAQEKHEAWVAENAINYDNLVRAVGDARAARIVSAIGSGVLTGMEGPDRAQMARALGLPNSGAALDEWARNRVGEVTTEASARSRAAGSNADLAEIRAGIERDQATWAREDRPGDVARMTRDLGVARATAVTAAMGSGVLIGLDDESRAEMARVLQLANPNEALDAWAQDRAARNERASELAFETDELRRDALEQDITIGGQTIKLNAQTMTMNTRSMRASDLAYERSAWAHLRDQAMAVAADGRAAIQEETELGQNIASAVANDDAEVLSFYLSAMDRATPLGVQVQAMLGEGARDRLVELRDGALARQALEAERVRVDDAYRVVNYRSAVLKLNQAEILTPLETLAMAEQFRLDRREAVIRLNSLEFTTTTDAIRVVGELARAMPVEFWDNPDGPVIARLRELGLQPDYFRAISEHEEWLRGDGRRRQGMDMLNVLLKSPPANEYDLEVMQNAVIEAVDLMDIRSPTARSAFVSAAMSIWAEQDENLRLRYLQLMASSANALDGGMDGADLKRVSDAWSSMHSSLNQQLNQYINTEVSLSKCATVFTIPELGPRITSRKDASAAAEGQPGRTCGQVFEQYDLLRERADNANLQQLYWVNQLSGATGAAGAAFQPVQGPTGNRGSYASPFPPRGQPPAQPTPVAPSNAAPQAAPPPAPAPTGGAPLGSPTPESSAAALIQPPAGSPVLPYHVATFNEIRTLLLGGSGDEAQSLINEMIARYGRAAVDAYMLALGFRPE